MDSTNNNNNNNNHLFLCEFKELRNEISAMKKRIVQLEESHEKQQEKICILERENHALKKKTELNTDDGNKAVGSKEKDQVEDTRSTSVSDSVSAGKKTKTNNNNNDEVVVISQHDNGDSFDSLSDDLLHKIVEFDGNCYSIFGSINKRCKNIYDVKEYKLKKETCLFGYGTLEMMLQHYLQKRKEHEPDILLGFNIAQAVIWYNRLDAIDWIVQLGDIDLLHELCGSAAFHGKINVLTKVFLKSNLMMLYELQNNSSLCFEAAQNGKLKTLKWLRKYDIKWSASTFTAARDRGYDEIVQYLRDEGCPETFEVRDESSESEQFDFEVEDGDF